ncbi:ribosomal protein S18 acetylase RimI-like enzyme [Humitalea rosea]|uniref:Ribosomal protein S18 acetylase RimI-like enzyme n=1 Tax=Humitalea rosea TaxID=990373 RepID=A0A2W7IMY8_9PROT|nr:GNAT family N-acetyltransferase [Humitalea rosea]PZW48323.1 ribosomal protein S18 acetylase RimI-like enzyme [Humitalea rosea]
MPAPTIRPVAQGDLAGWSVLWDGYNRIYDRRLEAAVIDTTWQRFFDPREPLHALVAEGEDGLLGLVHYLFHRSTTMLGPICYLENLFIAEAARRQGIARGLIEAVNDAARAVGADRVYWQVHETNHAAMRLYDQLAWRSGFLVYRQNI